MLGIIFILVVACGFIFLHTTGHRTAATTAKTEPVNNSQNQISDEFREVAGDAFDKVMALQSVELEGKLFYEPVRHEAELAVNKAIRKESNLAESRLASQILALEMDSELYRGANVALDSCAKLNYCTSQERKEWLARAEDCKKSQKDTGETIRKLLQK